MSVAGFENDAPLNGVLTFSVVIIVESWVNFLIRSIWIEKSFDHFTLGNFQMEGI